MPAKMIVPGSILYVSSLWAVKVAMVLFYKRLAAPKSTLQLIYNVALGLLVLFGASLHCTSSFSAFPTTRDGPRTQHVSATPATSPVDLYES